MQRVIVVGAGVSGLTSAVRLLEAGHRVDVLARDLPRETTSSVAAAIWYPYLALPQDKVTAWSARTYDVLAGLADTADTDDTGVRMRRGTEALPDPTPDPWWISAVPRLDRVAPPQGYADAWSMTVPIIEMPVYLGWLLHQVQRLGGTVTRMSLSALPEAVGGSRQARPALVVNAAGIGAKHLAADPGVGPVRGQVVYVEQFGLERWWLDESGPTYVVPRGNDIVVGGTEIHGEWSRTPDPAVALEILARASRLVPELATARVLGHKVGLRPARAEVRVERVDDVVHSYGHGGAGVTLSWGCAEEVVRLVEG